MEAPMSPRNWLRSWLPNHPCPPARRSRARLAAETLEAREVPAGFSFPDFASSAGLSFLGAATVTPDQRLRLTPAVGGMNGAAWFTAEKQFVGLAFETTFQFQLTYEDSPGGATNGGSDGFVFAIQNHVPTYLTGGGGTLGYDGLPNS